jgi:hypothetical protein
MNQRELGLGEQRSGALEGAPRRLGEVDRDRNGDIRPFGARAHGEYRLLGLPHDSGRRAAEQLVSDDLAMRRPVTMKSPPIA